MILWRNTYLVSPRLLFNFVISDTDYEDLLEAKRTSCKTSLPNRVMQNLLPWFWPQIVEAKYWAAAAENSRYEPRNYERSEPRPLLKMLLRQVPKEWSILDLGCNMGADLSIMWANGHTNLHGVDAGRRALELFAENYSEIFRDDRVRRDLFQRYLTRQKAHSFDVIYSHGATLELVHPSFPIVREVCRVARRAVYIAIMEEGHSYPRLWIRQFEDQGFRLVMCDRPADLKEELSYLVFYRRNSILPRNGHTQHE